MPKETYTETSEDREGVIRDSDGAFIPNDPDNSDWQKYIKAVEAGYKPNPAPKAT